MLERYRKTMDIDVLHSWANDAQLKIDASNKLLRELKESLQVSYSMSAEGRKYLKNIEATLNT